MRFDTNWLPFPLALMQAAYTTPILPTGTDCGSPGDMLPDKQKDPRSQRAPPRHAYRPEVHFRKRVVMCLNPEYRRNPAPRTVYHYLPARSTTPSARMTCQGAGLFLGIG